MATPTLTAQNGNIMTGTLPANASGFNAQGDIIYNTQPKVPLGSAVMTSKPAAEAYKQSAGWIANEQNQAAVRAANAKLAEQTAAAANAANASKNRTTAVATNALEGFVRTSNKGELSASEIARMDQITQITGQLSNLAGQMDSRAASQVDSVIKEYEGLSRRQEVANTQYEGGVSTAGLSSGRSRYASEIQAGVQSAAVASGIQALSDIQMKKQKLVMEIEQARDTQKYKVLTEAVSNLKDLNKQERQAAQDMKDNFYKEQTYMRQNQDYIGKTLAPSIVGQLTGDPAKDNQLLAYVAEQNGVSQASLVMAVDNYKQDVAKSAPGIVQEYNYLKSNGQFNGSITEYMKYKANLGDNPASAGKIVSQEDANYIGIPAVAGLPKNKIIYDLAAESIAPKWFTETIGGAVQSLEPSVVQEAWDKVKKDPEVQSYIKGLPKDSTGGYSSTITNAANTYKAKAASID